MAKSLSNIGTLSLICLFFFMFLLLSPNDGKMAEAKVCERRSKTWTGFCGSSASCNRQCINREDARSGACHFQFPVSACFCYFNCLQSKAVN